MKYALFALTALCACASGPAASQPTYESFAAQRAEWNRPVAPFTIHGNVHYVGVAGVSAFLVTTPEGHILIDGGLVESAPLISSNIAALGFDIRDVRFLLNSHAHWDHSGGLAALKAASGAAMIASAADKPALEAGMVDYGPSAGVRTPPVSVDRVIADGETVTIGGTTLTAVMTPGHSKGCTSWTMRTRGADGRARSVFFHCSATVAGHSLEPPAYDRIVEDFRYSFKRVAEMSADIFLASHPMFFDMEARRAAQIAGDANAFVDPRALQAFNTSLQEAFEAELAAQRRR